MAKRPHLCKGALCFHGAFNLKSAARAKEAELKSRGKSPFIRFLAVGGRRFAYVVITRRK